MFYMFFEALTFLIRKDEYQSMYKAKRLVTFALLFVLSTLLLKALLPATGHNNCNEFAHVHWYKFNKISNSALDTIATNSYHTDGDDYENCHAAQFIFNTILKPVRIFLWTNTIPKITFEFLARLESHFKSPDLDPPRRPPRHA